MPHVGDGAYKSEHSIPTFLAMGSGPSTWGWAEAGGGLITFLDPWPFLPTPICGNQLLLGFGE